MRQMDGGSEADHGPECLAWGAKKAAKALGIGVRLLWEMTNRGEIPHAKLGRRIVYPVADLRKWLSEQSCRPR